MLFFYVQVPRESLLFVIPAFGGVVSWEGEGAPFNESDQSITHQVSHFARKMWDACIYSNFNLKWVPVLLLYCHG